MSCFPCFSSHGNKAKGTNSGRRRELAAAPKELLVSSQPRPGMPTHLETYVILIRTKMTSKTSNLICGITDA